MRYPTLFALVVVLSLSMACSSKKATVSEAMPVKATEDIRVKIITPYGDMVAELYDETPLHRDNFMKLVDSTYYDSLLFHRVISQFMIQGGDPASKGAPANKRLGMGGPGYTIPAEIQSGLYHYKGALSAARTGGPTNPEKKSSGSQFYVVQGRSVDSLALSSLEQQLKKRLNNSEFTFTAEERAMYINNGGTPHLDGDYTVFGQVIEGLNIIDSIARVAVDRNNRPIEDVSMRIIRLN